MLPFMEPIHIVGRGPLSLFWGSFIRSAFPSYPLAVLFASHHKPTPNDGNLPFLEDEEDDIITVCSMLQGRPRMSRVPFQFIGEAYPAPIRNLLLTHHSATEDMPQLVSRLAPNPNIVILSPGALDIRDKLSKELPGDPKYLMCSTTQTAEMEGSLEEDMIYLTPINRGESWVGGMPPMAQLWDQSGLSTASVGSNEMEVYLWKQLAKNCLASFRNIENETNASLSHQVLAEIALVAQGAMPPDHPQQQAELSVSSLDAFVQGLEETGPQGTQYTLDDDDDLEEFTGSGLTPAQTIDLWNGYVVRKGKELGIATPAGQELYERLLEVVPSKENP